MKQRETKLEQRGVIILCYIFKLNFKMKCLSVLENHANNDSSNVGDLY